MFRTLWPFLTISLKILLDTFDNNSVMKYVFIKYLKSSCWWCSDYHFIFKSFSEKHLHQNDFKDIARLLLATACTNELISRLNIKRLT